MGIKRIENKRDGVTLMDYCLFFIKEIKESLESNEIKNAGDELTLELGTSGHPYWYDGLSLVVKSFKMCDFDVRIPAFTSSITNNGSEEKKTYTYKWVLKKK